MHLMRFALLCLLLLAAAACDPDDNGDETPANNDPGDVGIEDEVEDPPQSNPLLDLSPGNVPEGMPCGMSVGSGDGDPSVSLFGYDAQGRVVLEDLLFEGVPFDIRRVFVYEGDDNLPAESLSTVFSDDLEFDNGMRSRTIHTYDDQRRIVGSVGQSEPFLGLDGEVSARTEVVYNGDNEWVLSTDEGQDLGSAGDGTLDFDGVPDEVVSFVFDPEARTLTFSEASEGKGEVVFRTPPSPVSSFVTQPSLFFLVDAEVIRLDFDGDGTFDVEERFVYGEDGRLDRVESVLLEGEMVLLTTTFDYVCD